MEDNTKNSDLPKFKYHSDPLKTKSIELKKIECSVCGKHSNYSYNGPFYSCEYILKNDGEICPDCIANGLAAKKYNGWFGEIHNCDVKNDEYIDELLHRTPGFHSVQSPHWLDHCGDFCDFVAKIGQVSGIGIGKYLNDILPEDLNEVLTTLKVNKEDLEEFMEEHGYVEGYLFKCLKCGKMRLYIDFE